MANNNILELNGRPLRYVVTKTPQTIKLLESDSGAFIVYEPYNDSLEHINENINKSNIITQQSYNELWASGHFIAGGYGVRTRKEQQNITYLANSYNKIIDEIYDQISYTYDFVSYTYYEMDETKVTRGVNDSTYKGPSNYDISYNPFSFGSKYIYLKELYDYIQNIYQLKNLEITNIEYNVKLSNNGKTYHNGDNVPIDEFITQLEIIIKGNTKNSGGINNIQIILNDNINNNQKELTLNNIDSTSNNPNIENTNFVLKFIKFYSNQDDIQYNIVLNDNKIIDNIMLDVLGTPEKSKFVNKIFAEKNRIIEDKYLLHLYGKHYIYYKTNNNENILLNYTKEILLDHTMYDNLSYVKIAISNNVNKISILINEQFGKLVDAKIIDNKTNNIYNVYNFRTTSKYEYNNNFIQYEWKIEQNLASFNKISCPKFISMQKDKLLFNEGNLILTFSNSMSDVDIESTDTFNNYWLYGPKLLENDIKYYF